MYRSFVAQRFRGLKELRITGFQRINLITGRNNVGKTSLLEALFIHSGAVNISLPFTIEALRGVAQFQGGLEESLTGLFNEFDTRPPIRLEGEDQLGTQRTCELRLTPAPTTIPTGEAQTSSTDKASAIELIFSDSLRPEPISTRGVIEKGQLRLDPAPIPPLYQGYFVTPRSLDHKAQAERFSELVKVVGEEDRLVAALQVLEPSIKAVRLLNHGGVSMIHLDVGLKRFMPLAHTGEGMVRLADILIAIGNSKNGVVLIDEFENGVHYSVLGKLWKATAEFAERFNTQVFATTHSLECVRAAHETFAHREYAFRLFRLQREKDLSVSSKMFSKDALDAALKTDLELR
jgi:AAA15 family ATPase/GTPase